MTAATLLSDLEAQGIELTLTERGTLRYRGDKAVMDYWLPEIRNHKSELIRLLRDPHPALMSPLTADQHNGIQEAITERAAIQEHDGGLSRSKADLQAARAMRIYRYRVADHPHEWLTLIAPGCDLEEARRTLVGQFGAARLIAVEESTGWRDGAAPNDTSSLIDGGRTP